MRPLLFPSLLAPSVSFFHQLRPAFTLFFFHIPSPVLSVTGAAVKAEGRRPSSKARVSPVLIRVPSATSSRQTRIRCCRFSRDNAPLLPRLRDIRAYISDQLSTVSFPGNKWIPIDFSLDIVTRPRSKVIKKKRGNNFYSVIYTEARTWNYRFASGRLVGLITEDERNSSAWLEPLQVCNQSIPNYSVTVLRSRVGSLLPRSYAAR